MKILPVALTQKTYKTNYTNNFAYKNNPILKNNFDTVSFKGKALSYDEVKPYKLQALMLSNEASKHYEASKEIVKNAYDELKVAKQAFKYAQSALSIANKNFGEFVVSLDNGNNLIIKPSFTPLGKLFTFVEVNEESIPIRSIKYYGHKNFDVTFYSDDNKRDIYDFYNGRIHISKNIKGNSVDNVYNFANGKLTSCLVGVSAPNNGALDKTQEAYLFDNDKLTSYCSGVSSVNSSELSEERFCFHNGSFIEYCKDFKNSSDDMRTWSSSYHFKDGKFLAYLDNVAFDKSNRDTIADEAIFVNKYGKYIKSSDFLCELNSDGSICIVDNE